MITRASLNINRAFKPFHVVEEKRGKMVPGMPNGQTFTYTNMGDKQIMHLFLHCLQKSPKRSGKVIVFHSPSAFQFDLISTQSKNYELAAADHSPRSSIILVVHDKWTQESW